MPFYQKGRDIEARQAPNEHGTPCPGAFVRETQHDNLKQEGHCAPLVL